MRKKLSLDTFYKESILGINISIHNIKKEKRSYSKHPSCRKIAEKSLTRRLDEPKNFRTNSQLPNECNASYQLANECNASYQLANECNASYQLAKKNSLIASRLLALHPVCQEIKINSLSHGLSSDIEKSPLERKYKYMEKK